MISPWAILVILSYMGITPVEAAFMPLKNGVPVPLLSLRNEYITMVRERQNGRLINYDELENNMWKFGLIRLHHYCQSDQCPRRFTMGCDKVNSIYNMEIGDFQYQYESNTFSDIVQLHRYLEKIGQSRLDQKSITEELKKGMVYMGWYEMKEFCNMNENWRESNKSHKAACSIVGTRVFQVSNSDWNLIGQSSSGSG